MARPILKSSINSIPVPPGKRVVAVHVNEQGGSETIEVELEDIPTPAARRIGSISVER